MIENDKQYEISKRWLEQINVEIKKVEKDVIDPLKKQVMLACLYNNKEDAEKELRFYESLQK